MDTALPFAVDAVMGTALPAAVDWEAANQAWLATAISALKERLQDDCSAHGAATNTDSWPAALHDRPPALVSLGQALGLSAFERDLLLLAAAVDLDAEVAALCAAARGDAAHSWPSFGLALAKLDAPHWSALAPDAPLRRWRLLQLTAGTPLTQAPLRIDERVLHYLVGVAHLDERLATVRRLPPPAGLSPVHAHLARSLAAAWEHGGASPTPVLLAGAAADTVPIAAAAAAMAGTGAALLAADSLPATSAELETLLTLWRREAVLSNLGVLVVDAEGAGPPLARLLDSVGGPLIVCDPLGRRHGRRPALLLEVRHPPPDEQRTAWEAILGSPAEILAGQFSLALGDIVTVATEARTRAGTAEGAAEAMAWEICRARLRARMDGLAQRVTTEADWGQLVLPSTELDTLHAIAAQLRQRTTVYERWGFATPSGRGLGISALFHGPSGTGKTLAAEVLAAALRLDLYRIDLSSVVSKYIGETEANLRRVFDTAEESGAILLFDEADALFGKRSEVKDSHDRYANIEVSYLLQRMETYRGLAILTSNMKSALDQAFLRRLRFVVQFRFPDEAHRAAIWRGAFPPGVPTDGLDPVLLAQLRVAGGNIRSIALNAAFLAADAGQPVRMTHVLAASRSEYVKLERQISPSEVAGWV
jgi:ATPase family associated with various cellular activities (AAA)